MAEWRRCFFGAELKPSTIYVARSFFGVVEMGEKVF